MRPAAFAIAVCLVAFSSSLASADAGKTLREMLDEMESVFPDKDVRVPVGSGASEMLDGSQSVLAALQVVLKAGESADFSSSLTAAQGAFSRAKEQFEAIKATEKPQPLSDSAATFLRFQGIEGVTDSVQLLSALATAADDSSHLISRALEGDKTALGKLVHQTCINDLLAATTAGTDFSELTSVN